MTELQKRLHELLRDRGACSAHELQEAYNRTRDQWTKYAFHSDIMNALTTGCNNQWFEYSAKVNRWYVGQVSPL